MSRYEINSTHNNSAEKKKVRLTKTSDEGVSGTNNQETNDFDYKKEKPPARSTYLRLIKALDKKIVQTATTMPVYNCF